MLKEDELHFGVRIDHGAEDPAKLRDRLVVITHVRLYRRRQAITTVQGNARR